MSRLLIQWLAIAATLMTLPHIIIGIEVHNWTAALVGAFVLGILHFAVRPLLVLLTLPVTILTFGLFLLFINAALFSFAGSITAGISVAGYGTAFIGALIVSVVSLLVRRILDGADGDARCFA